MMRKSVGPYPSSKKRKVDPKKVKPKYMPLYYGVSKGAEKKFNDVTGTATTLLTTPQLILLNGVSTGTDYNTRIGREVNMTSEYLRMTIFSTGTGWVRMMLIYDKQPNGSAPALTDILVSQSVVAPNNLNNKDRFCSISDKVYKLDTASQLSVFVKKYKKMNTPATYSGTGNTIASISTGSLYLILLSTSDTPSCSYYSRVRYVDK